MHWEIEVARDGEYEFALRRYPVEAQAPIRGVIPIPERLRDFQYFAQRYSYAISHKESKVLPIVAARMKIASFEERKSVPEEAEPSADYELNAQSEVIAVKFVASLKAGTTKLEASFCDEQGKPVTAPYYVTVTRR